MDSDRPPNGGVTRREFVGIAIAGGVAANLSGAETAAPAGSPPMVACNIVINNTPHAFTLDPRVTLLDLLREHLH